MTPGVSLALLSIPEQGEHLSLATTGQGKSLQLWHSQEKEEGDKACNIIILNFLLL